MKTIILFTIFLFFFSGNLFCQHYFDTTYSEKTALRKVEKEAIDYMIEVYKKQLKVDSECNDCYDYVVDVFSKIDSLERFYYLIDVKLRESTEQIQYFNDTLAKIYIISEYNILMNGKEGGYFGDKIKILFNNKFSIEHGYIKMEIDYPAAGVSYANITFILNKDIYETYRYFTNHGGGYEVYTFKVNGIEKYSGEYSNPYFKSLY